MKSAIASTPQMDVGLLPKIVDTAMPVKNVDSEDMEKRRALSKKLAEMGAQPRYLRYNLWRTDDFFTHSSSEWTLTAKPLPSPALKELENPIVTQTIIQNPHLFKIVTPINVDLFESYLATHPNRPFVVSVCQGLREGFWPWADTHTGVYPDTHDESLGTPRDAVEAEFMRTQRDHEIKMG
jgi:hypothetical protein